MTTKHGTPQMDVLTDRPANLVEMLLIHAVSAMLIAITIALPSMYSQV